MVLAWARRFALGVAVAACSTSSPSNKLVALDGGAREQIAFDVVGVLKLSPGQSTIVSVVGAPNLRASLSLEGSYGDASLDDDRLTLDSSGHASFTLLAPTSPSTFGVRATAETTSASARLDVAVSRDGFTTVRVTPNYKGSRAATSFTASAFVGTTCKDLGGASADGSPARTAPTGASIDLPSIPAGGNVAVAARAGHFAVGCADVSGLTPNDVRPLVVDVYDRPIDLGALALETRLTFAPTMSELASFAQRMDGAATLALSKFSPVGSPQDEATRLLDAMQAAAQSSAFATARQASAWDGKAASWIGQHAPSMRARAQAWLASGASQALTDLVFHLGPVMGQKASVTLDAAATDGGFSASAGLSVVVDAADTLRLEGPFDVYPTALLTRAANASAALDVKTASNVAAALAIQMDCDGLAGLLTGNQTYAYAMCDRACLRVVCEKGLGAMWSAARGASEKTNDVLVIGVNASGACKVGDHAEPLSLLGTWSGQTKGGSYATSTLHGDIKAATGMAPN